MRDRLLLGPLLILAIVAIAWLDGYVDAAEIPARLRPLFGGRSTAPPGTVFLPVVALLACVGAVELSRILRGKAVAASKRLTCASALLGLGVSCLVPSIARAESAVAVVSTAAGVVLVGSLVYYARGRTTQGVVAGAGGSLLAFVYLGLMFGFVLAIRRDHSAWLVLVVLLVVKSADIGAYFTGSLVGRHKLIPWLSPGKTWEGLAGGVAFAGATAGIAGACFGGPGLPGPVGCVLGGVMAALLGQFGDLVASAFKRDAGLKDSGRVLPGFGGMLDVLDSPILVMPAAYWWLSLWRDASAGPGAYA